MNKFNLPTYKNLNINLKQILWSKQPKTFNQFKALCEREFVIKLNIFLTKTNQLSNEAFKACYQVIFYHMFINFRKEIMLKLFLEKNNFVVEVSCTNLDYIYETDLIAAKNNQKYFIQLKSNFTYQSSFKKLKQIANISNGTPILAIKTPRSFIFYDLDKNIKINLI